MSDPTNLMAQVREGMDVYCSDGEKLGSVGEVRIGSTSGPAVGTLEPEERSYFQVKRGLFGLGNDIWFPAEVVDSVTEDRVNLSCTKDEAPQRGWDHLPETPGRM